MTKARELGAFVSGINTITDINVETITADSADINFGLNVGNDLTVQRDLIVERNLDVAGATGVITASTINATNFVGNGSSITNVSTASTLVSYASTQSGAVQRNVRDKILDNYISVKDFGAVGDGVTDDLPAFNAAWAASEIDNSSRNLYIPPGNYHLSDFWSISCKSNYRNKTVWGYGAVLDNTVSVTGLSISLKGIEVNGSPDHGFVFCRGQGSHHCDLRAIGNAGSGFQVGPTNKDGIQTYAGNSQVTRCLFSKCVAQSNSKHGFELNTLTFNSGKSYFNANTLVDCSLLSNQKGLVTTGGSLQNYNTAIGLNCEGNSDISVDVSDGTAWAFFGGHFVNSDDSRYAVRAGRSSVVLGGRTIGFVSAKWYGLNSSIGGWLSGINEVSSLTNVGRLQTGKLYASNGWMNFLPNDRIQFNTASNNINGHVIVITLQKTSGFLSFNKVFLQLRRSQTSGGYDQTSFLELNFLYTVDDDALNESIKHDIISSNSITINSVSANNGIIEINLDTPNVRANHDLAVMGLGLPDYTE